MAKKAKKAPSEAEIKADKLQEEVDALLEKRDVLEEKCDTLPLCKEDDGCSRCETRKKINQLDEKIEEIEEKIEEILAAEDDFE